MSFNFDWSAFADQDNYLIFNRLKTVISDAFNRRRSNGNGYSNGSSHGNKGYNNHTNNYNNKSKETSDIRRGRNSLSSSWQNSRSLYSNSNSSGELGDGSLDFVEITQLTLGTRPPDLGILEIDDLGNGRFRGVLRLEYEGDAAMEFQTKVEANPLASMQMSAQAQGCPYSSFCTPQFLTETCSSLVVPIMFRVKNIKISSLVMFVFSPGRGVTLVFRHDPSITMDIESTLDGYADPTMRSRPIFNKIINRLRLRVESTMLDLFRNEIPELVHEASLNANVSWDALKVETKKPFTSNIKSSSISSKTKLESSSSSSISSRSPSVGDIEDDEDLAGVMSSSSFLDHIQNSLNQLYEEQRTLSLETPIITDTVHRSNFEACKAEGESSQSHRREKLRRRKIKLSDINKLIDSEPNFPPMKSRPVKTPILKPAETPVTPPRIINNANGRNSQTRPSLSSHKFCRQKSTVHKNSSPLKTRSNDDTFHVLYEDSIDYNIENGTAESISFLSPESWIPPPQYEL
ncbi:hypothetical protein NADFUDRAFT_53049 [Nadsonia fulvescens var. elongata DSM 6958]|uniref:SMP-LTD domain-containing protein n=1 Tax=Nadsonia fulvescens var. elongata DSM 6958 TaxID=857566 RepID=A0A1E3PF82_9ASCO|nr:hypothetical protein NADFUDRAFT_53049 [Nadsonia fulvescens var. elongata DSM 6958]